MLGKLPVPERPTNLDNSRARAYCACSRCGWGLFGHFFSHLSLLFSFSFWETARYRLKYCQGPTVLAVGAGMGCLDIFLSSITSLFFLLLGDGPI